MDPSIVQPLDVAYNTFLCLRLSCFDHVDKESYQYCDQLAGDHRANIARSVAYGPEYCAISSAILLLGPLLYRCPLNLRRSPNVQTVS